MASVEAVEHLLNGVADWNEYINSEGVIDLTFADLTDCDLRDRRFAQCDLSAAQLARANLDGSSFIKTNLTGAQLTNASLVNCRLESVIATRIDLSKAIIRNSKFSDVNFKNANALAVTMENCKLQRCQVVDASFDQARFLSLDLKRVIFENLRVSDLRFSRCKFSDDCSLADWILINSEMEYCSFKKCDITNLSFDGGSLIKSEMLHCNVNQLILHNTSVTQLDLSASVVKEVDIATLNPASAIFLNTAFISCIWPRQSGRVSLTGRYIPSPYLLAQPVQDVYGISPTIRRETGDAQYLTKKLAETKGRSQRALLRVWGATSAFGQSLFRLTICSALNVLLHALALLAIRGELFGFQYPNFELLAREVGNLGQVFLGFSGSSIGTSNVWEGATLLSARITGFLSLGLWMTIASSQFNKLSSD